MAYSKPVRVSWRVPEQTVRRRAVRNSAGVFWVQGMRIRAAQILQSPSSSRGGPILPMGWLEVGGWGWCCSR